MCLCGEACECALVCVPVITKSGFQCSLSLSLSHTQPIYCSCFLKFARSGPNMGQFTGIVALCKLASIPRLKEMVVGTFFKTKHALDLSYTAIDTRYTCVLLW